jgi:tRNA pseudouridine38-40 synthase
MAQECTQPPTVPQAAPPGPIQPARRRYRLVVAYDGTLFHGWQKQHPPGCEPLRTVQGVVEAAVVEALQQPINLVGASRTGAGVHAQGQVAQFDAATRIPISRLAAAINSRLPEDVEILTAAEAAPDFEAINQARNKQYRYRVFNAIHRPLRQRNYVYHYWHNLDVAKMNAAAVRLVGRHDFASFTAAGHERLTTVRTIHACVVEEYDGDGLDTLAPGKPPIPPSEAALVIPAPTKASGGSGLPALPREREVHIIVQGDGFLYNMVRIIAGTLLEVGRGAVEPEAVDRALAGCDRRLAGPTLPPQGLCLEWIRYGDDTEAAP